MRTIFIVGSGRSGTNLLGKVLSSSLSAHNFYEQRYLWTGISPLSEHCAPYSQSRVRDIRRHFSENSSGAETVIDKTPGNIFRVPQVLSVFPEAKFIFMVRNPLDNLSSRERLLVSEQSTFNRAKRIFLHFLTLLKRKNIPFNRLPLFVIDQFLVFLFRRLYRVKLLGLMDRVEGAVDAYRETGTVGLFINQLIKSEQEFNLIKDRADVIMLRYEDLHFHTNREISRLEGFLGLTQEEAVELNTQFTAALRPETISNVSDVNERFPDLPEKWRRELTNYMDRLNY